MVEEHCVEWPRFKSGSWVVPLLKGSNFYFLTYLCIYSNIQTQKGENENGNLRNCQRSNFIPASLRRKYGIKDGTKIIITDIGDAIVLKPVTEQYLRNLQGSLKGKGGLKVLLEERAKDKEREK